MKPYVICHMMTTVDGRILPDQWHPPFEDSSLYEDIHGELAGDAWLVGRITGAEFAKRDAAYPEVSEPVERKNWFARKQADSWAIVLDRSGKIAWGRADIDGDPLVVVLTRGVSEGHLAGLREDGVSYIFAGENEIDLAAALETLNRELRIERILLEGGGAVNGALLSAGLVDELSQIVVPSVEGVSGNPALFDVRDYPGKLPKMVMEFMSCEPREKGSVWLRYRFSWEA